MKTSAAILLLLVSPILLRADDSLLQNGDFADGIAHWYGDCHTPDNGGDMADASSTSTNPAGIVVKLHSSDWTKVVQDFDGKAGEYLLTITYSTSPDLKFSTDPADYTNIPAKIEFNRLRSFNCLPGHWIIVVNDLGALHFHYWEIAPNPSVSGTQKITANVSLNSNDEEKKGFYLFFPPGDGMVTLTGITLVNKNPGSPSNPPGQ